VLGHHPPRSLRRGRPAPTRLRLGTNATVCITITDCGPRTRSFCGEQSCCGGNCRVNRVLDLTPAAFSAIGSLDSGVLPVVITE
jgi:hypothetical protein